MSEAIIVALIAAGGAVLSNWVIYRKGRNDEREERARLDQKTADRLSSIEHKLDEHNGYAKKFEDIVKSMVRIETEIAHLKEAG